MSDISTAQTTAPDPSRRLFIGWLDASGAAFYDTLFKWIGYVFPGVEITKAPDVLADPQWQVTLARSLRGVEAALVCVVGEQAASPWVHLQLGACFRALGTSRPVVPVLLDVPDAALSSSPLGLFQAVRPTKEDFRRLVRDLSFMLSNPSSERIALARFESTFDDLLSELDLVPGSVLQSFQIVLVLPDRVLPVPNSTPATDHDWTSVMRRMTAIQRMPGLVLAPFEAADLECLDLTREEWMRAPRLVSRLTTRSLALVHRAVASTYHREAKAIAKYVKQHLIHNERSGLRSGEPR